MKKRVNYKMIHSLLIVICILIMGIPVFGKTISYKAAPCVKSIVVDGTVHRVRGYAINNSNYYKLRDIATIVNNTPSEFNIVLEKSTQVIEIKQGESYGQSQLLGDDHWDQTYKDYYWNLKEIILKPTQIKIKANGKHIDLEAYVINNNTYFKLRDIAKYASFDIKTEDTIGDFEIIVNSSKDMAKIENKYFKTPSILNPEYINNWASVKNTYLFDNKDGTVSYAVAGVDNEIVIETFNAALQSVGHQIIPYELPIFGGLHKANGYYYAIFGQENKDENSSRETYRIVKYNNQGKRLDKVSITGGETITTIPFYAGCTRMDSKNNILAIHASRERFKSEDGLNHQSNITFIVDTDTMKLKYVSDPFPFNHASHSFNQFVRFDGNMPVFVDHGDYYPRSVCLTKGDMKKDVFPIAGTPGNNYTGVEVGGFEISSDYYLVAGTSINQQGNSPKDEVKNVFIAALPKNGQKQATIKWVTSYKSTDNVVIRATPKFVKVSDTRFVLMWKEETKDLKYIILNEKGEQVGAINQIKYSNLSECDPIVKDGKLMWLAHDKDNITVYEVPLALN